MHWDHRQLVLLVTASLLLGSRTPAAAQAARRQSAALLATATVVGTHLGATSLRGLSFGAVHAGEPTSVRPDGRMAAAWQLGGTPNSAMLVRLELPSELRQADGTTAVPIRFAKGAGQWSGASARTFDPAQGTMVRFGPETTATLEVRLGATVMPPVETPPGVYRGTVTLIILCL